MGIEVDWQVSAMYGPLVAGYGWIPDITEIALHAVGRHAAWGNGSWFHVPSPQIASPTGNRHAARWLTSTRAPASRRRNRRDDEGEHR